MKRIVVVCMLLLGFSALILADVPLRQEQLVYSILAFNGRDYSGTFSGEASDAIYIIADTDNFVTVRKTFVYFWAITGELRTDTQSLNIPFVGNLEITKRGHEDVVLPISIYTYYNVRGEYELNWEVRTGMDAYRLYKDYRDELDAYYEQSENYQRRQAEYENTANALATKISQLRGEGADVAGLLEQFNALHAPVEPQAPQEYVVPPIEPQLGFLLNLPAGEYSVRFINDDGTVMQDSNKKLVVFSRRRDRAVGVEVIPGDKWTRSVDSRTASSVLYVDGSTDLYLRPYYQTEYNDLYYEKMKRNDAKGNPNMMKWVQTEQIPSARIAVAGSSGGETIIGEELFYIEQVQGGALGYLVVPFDPEGKHKGLSPSLKACHISLAGKDRRFRLHILDSAGGMDRPLPGGERLVRIISPSPSLSLLLVLGFVPVLVMVVVLFRRSRRYRV